MAYPFALIALLPFGFGACCACSALLTESLSLHEIDIREQISVYLASSHSLYLYASCHRSMHLLSCELLTCVPPLAICLFAFCSVINLLSIARLAWSVNNFFVIIEIA